MLLIMVIRQQNTFMADDSKRQCSIFEVLQKSNNPSLIGCLVERIINCRKPYQLTIGCPRGAKSLAFDSRSSNPPGVCPLSTSSRLSSASVNSASSPKFAE